MTMTNKSFNEALNEKMGVNIDVQNATNQIVDFLWKKIYDEDFLTSDYWLENSYKIRRGGVLHEIVYTECDLDAPNDLLLEFANFVKQITFRILTTTKENTGRIENSLGGTLAYYNPNKKQIILYFPIIIEKGEGFRTYTKRYFAGLLSHELLHAFQHKFGDLNIGKYYESVGDIMNDIENSTTDLNELDDITKYKYIIASGLYYFSNAEIDAKANEFFQQLCNTSPANAEEAMKTKVYDEFKYEKNAVLLALSSLKTGSDAYDVKSYFEEKLNTKFYSLALFLRNGIKRAENKFDKVISYYFSDKEELDDVKKTTINPFKYLDTKAKEREAFLKML